MDQLLVDRAERIAVDEERARREETIAVAGGREVFKISEDALLLGEDVPVIKRFRAGGDP